MFKGRTLEKQRNSKGMLCSWADAPSFKIIGIAEAVIIQVHKSSTSFKLLESKNLQLSENEQTITYNLTIKPKKFLFLSMGGEINLAHWILSFKGKS